LTSPWRTVAARSTRTGKPNIGPGKSAAAAEPGVGGDAPERVRLVVGLGASAGGIDAFRAFFAAMPVDSGMSFVLIQHLDPRYASSLVPIVAGYTTMPVHLAEDGAEIGPNQVHVIPPDAIMTIRDGMLHLERPAPPAARRMSINTFLISLAEDQGEDAVGIILAGFGTDGALGVAAVKEHGGLTLSQAEFDHHAKSGMPQSAVSGGFVDHVLPAEEMPRALLDYQQRRTIGGVARGPDDIRQDLPGHLATICAVLHGRLGRDFSQYKADTLLRRIQRRMHVLRLDEVAAYIEQLRTLPHEAELLFRELIISVTRFFRDPAAFAALETRIIPGLVETDSTEPIRAWVAGCATGEEAYSLAILLKEGLARSHCRRPVQIFATDIDARAIEAARAGLFPGTIAADVPAEQLERNFIKEDGNYRVTKDLREMILFSAHDLVKDPPFSRLDLVSCRNLLIYFRPQLQLRVLTTFHYALRSGGYLFLGPSESVIAQSRLFTPLDKRHRLYGRRDTVARLPAFPLSRPSNRLPPGRSAMAPADDDIGRLAHRAMARYAPAFLVVDRQHDILRFWGQTARYLEPNTGVASLHLFNLLHADLRAVVRAGLRQAAATGSRVLPDTVSFATSGRYEAVNLIVEPLPMTAEEQLFVVAFQEVGPVSAPKHGAAPDLPGQDDDVVAPSLTRELLATRERLRNVSEELEAANDKLQSSNEEYLSVNEDLQSANEELETSKEELQSLNEELQTINAELNYRNDSLVRANSDLANLFDSTSIATLFLDNESRIRRFTPRLLEIFKVREGDEGRPISDIVSHLTRDGLAHDVQQVLRSLTGIEREVVVAEGTSYLMQVRPYRDLSNVVDGAVVTFIDISERKKHEQAHSLLAAIVESSQDAIISHDLGGIITSWNAGAERLYGYSPAEAIGRSMTMLLAEAVPDGWPEVLARLERGQRIAQFDGAWIAKEGRPVEVAVTISPVREGDGRIVGASMVARDVGECRAAEQKTALLLGELDHRVKNILAIVTAVVSQTLKTSGTPEAFATEVEGRVKAIAQAHNLLTQAGQGELSLRAILLTELAPYDGGNGNLVITGRDVALTPKAGLALAMAIHELTSNAVKHGALSAGGRLTVTWQLTGSIRARLLTLAWTEAEGPPVQPPVRRGFGTTLIERTLAYELDAEVHREFLEAGPRCTIALPLTAEVGRIEAFGEAGGERDDHR
jgi:two-component system CheB/CheR fusion protein